MKKLLLLIILLVPVFCFAQSIQTKNNLVNYYRDLGYNVYDDYDFTMREGDEWENLSFRLTYDRSMKIVVKCINTYNSYYEYDFSLVIMGR